MVESWSKENGPSAGSALVHKERAKVWDGGPSKPWCPAVKCSNAHKCGMDARRDFYSLTQREKKKKSNQVEISFFLWRWSGRWMEKSNC